MHIYLFVSENKTPFYPATFLSDYSHQEFPVATIKEARELSSYARNGFAQKTAIVIPHFDKTSLEAQNALLKTLEEPGRNTSFILTARSTRGIAETILSRAFVQENQVHEKSDIDDEVQTFLTDSTKRLIIVSQIKDREAALEFVHTAMSKALSENPSMLEALTKCFNAIEGNGNVALHLTNLVVNLSL